MKGMQRIKRHKSFVNVVKYVLKPGSHHKSDPVIIGGNMTSDCANELIAEFKPPIFTLVSNLLI
ncbi:relaxase/mobilization nuclease domain protein [Enterobacter cloacae S611]|uniref:Relaxase/mobilization nuclease domain protein n=1 Tax=Enterobacter cloacae S611 TaxID=1399146 RepID=A0ABN0Q4Y5_ENTCL|nr:relaxase/mobilization nuclease domain protein [Enterobacter cloacae S611]